MPSLSWALKFLRFAVELAGGEVERLRLTTLNHSRLLQRLMDNNASAIIHASESTMDQAEIDALMEG